MKMTIWMTAAILVSVSAMAPAMANDEPQAGQSETAAGSLLDRFYVNYLGTFHGPELNNIGSSYMVDRNGAPTKQTIYFDSEITTAYTTKDRSIGIGPDFTFQAIPVMGQGLVMGDTGIKAFNKTAISTSNLTVATSLYLQAPTSQYSRSRGEKFGVKTTPYAMYHFSGTRFTLGTWTEAKVYADVVRDKLYKLWALPYVSYQLVPKLSATVGYEMEIDHYPGQGNFQFSSYVSDFQPGLTWFISRDVVFNPYFQVFTTNHVSYDRTAIGAVISATVL